MKRCRILSIITRLNNGGPAKIAIWTSGLLDQKKFETILLTGKPEKGEEDISWFARQYGVEPVMISCLKRSPNPVCDFLSIIKIYRMIKKVNPHVLHTHMSKAGFLGRLAGVLHNIIHRRKIKIVHTFHGHVFHSYFSRPKTGFYIFLERLMARRSDVLIAISKKLKAEILEFLGQRYAEKFRVIPLGIDFSPTRSRTVKEPGGWIHVGMLGRLAPIKNIGLALDIARVLKKKQLPVKIMVGGSGQPDDFKKLNRDRLDNIFFVGGITSPEAFWNRMDMALITSRNEGTPVSLIEAMVAGIPFVASDVGGIPDMMAGEAREIGNMTVYKNGILVKTFNAVDFVQAIRFYLSEPVRTKAGRESRRYAAGMYSSDRLLADMEALYQGLCES